MLSWFPETRKIKKTEYFKSPFSEYKLNTRFNHNHLYKISLFILSMWMLAFAAKIGGLSLLSMTEFPRYESAMVRQNIDLPVINNGTLIENQRIIKYLLIKSDTLDISESYLYRTENAGFKQLIIVEDVEVTNGAPIPEAAKELVIDDPEIKYLVEIRRRMPRTLFVITADKNTTMGPILDVIEKLKFVGAKEVYFHGISAK